MHYLHIWKDIMKTASIFFSMTLGENIKRFRKLAGLTQVQLAKKVGTQQYSLAKYEKDVVAPSKDLLPKLASTLGVSLDILFGNEQTAKGATAEPKRSSREGKLLDVFRELPTQQQRALLQQAEGLLLRKKSS
jgi:transcriptional regulator with XRE-family HTH domain